MRELPHGWFLSELLAKGLVGEKEIDRVISRLHRFYQAETPTPEIGQWGTPEKLRISTDENFACQNERAAAWLVLKRVTRKKFGR